MRVGFLKFEPDPMRERAVALFWLSGLTFVMDFLFAISSDSAKHRILTLSVFSLGLGFAAVGAALNRGTKRWRSGIRTCNGAVWDPEHHKASMGSFVITIEPKAQKGSALSSVQSHVVLDVTPAAISELAIEDGRPELHITISQRRFRGFYRPYLTSFARRTLTGPDDNRLRVLADSRITSLAGDPLFGGLRELGRILAALGPNTAVQGRILVELPPPPEARPDEGFSSAPSMVGGIASAVAGVGPAVGVIAGTALNRAAFPSPEQIAAEGSEQMMTLIYGGPNQLPENCLRSVAAEFGWTIEAPGGIQIG